jgi:hypothetical protein
MTSAQPRFLHLSDWRTKQIAKSGSLPHFLED